MGVLNNTLTVYGPTWDSAVGGNYVFSGTNPNAIQLNTAITNLKTSQGGQGYTFIVWARSTGGISGWRKLIGNNDGDNYIDIYQNPSGYYAQECGSTLYVDGALVSSASYYMINAGWHCYAGTNSNSGTLTNPAGLLTVGNEPNLSSYPFVGNIAKVELYNRVLSVDELQQNFNALRSRFGI